MSWGAGAAPKSHAGSSDGDTGIDILSEVLTRSVLVRFGRYGGMKNRVRDGLVFFFGRRVWFTLC